MSTEPTPSSPNPPHYPRIIITYCTQCKWLLRAAYHAQELLSTFSTSLGEVSLRPATGGAYYVDVEVAETSDTETSNAPITYRSHRIWDRKAQDGFPETKILKRLVRDVIEPERGLGHVDREHGSAAATAATTDIAGSASVGADVNAAAGLGAGGDVLSVVGTRIGRGGGLLAADDTPGMAATMVEDQTGGSRGDAGAKGTGSGIQCEDCA